MDDIDKQDAKFLGDEEVQITDLDVPDSPRQRRITQIIGGLKVPWIRYSFTGTLILLLLGSFFLQWRQSIPTISDVIGTQTPGFLNATTSQEMVFIQDTHHLLTAYQAMTGRIQWHTQLPSTASIDAEGQMLYCYFVTSPNSTGMKALDSHTGKIIWQNDALPEAPSFLSISSLASSSSSANREIEMQRTSSIPGATFLYNDNTIYLQNASNMIYAFQATTGHLSWSSQIPTQHYLVIDGETLYALAPPSTPTIQASRLSDGRHLWTYSLPEGTWAQSEMDGVVYLYAADGATLIALRGSDGHKLWSYSASDGQPMITSLATRGIEYLLQQDGTLVGIRTSDGFVLWRAPLTMLQKPISPTTGLLMDHNNILLYDAQPGVTTSVYILQASNGHLRWHTPKHIVNPVPLDGVLYTMHDDGLLDAWRESDGDHLWSYSTLAGARVVQNTNRDASLLFLLDNTGTFYTLNTSDGKLLWSYH